MNLPKEGQYWSLGFKPICPHDYLPGGIWVEKDMTEEDLDKLFVSEDNFCTKETWRQLMECGCLRAMYQRQTFKNVPIIRYKEDK